MKTFEKILIANRGEIALRVIRAARQLGIRTAVLYAADDAESLPVSLADEAFLLPGKTLKETYLNQEKTLHIALSCGAQAIHPGYGFLAENADFAQRITQAGIIFIGPSPENIRLMGEKNRSLSYVHSLGIPILPSFRGTRQQLMQHIGEISFPVMVKASHGGGGKGMLICHHRNELAPALETAERQALTWFGNGELFLEKYLPRARHVEVQLMADHYGHVLHFYERECSIQRHFQKIIEEAPSPSVNAPLRDKLTSTALKIAHSMNYRNAGTIEFLLDELGNYYFLEMNTRIQVEHPVTEMVTNTDLVALQLQVAAGNPLSVQQQDIRLSGHAIEVRLCAEDTGRNFLPSAGKLTRWDIPQKENVRVEGFMAEGKSNSPNYDSLLAKIIVWEKSRSGAIHQMKGILSQSVLTGIHTNHLFLQELVSGTVFEQNKFYTRYVDENLAALNASIAHKRDRTDKYSLVAAYLIFHFLAKETSGNSVWQQIGFWRMPARIKVLLEESGYDSWIDTYEGGTRFIINGKKYEVAGWQIKGHSLEIVINNKTHSLHCMEEGGHTVLIYHGHLFELHSNYLIQQAVVTRQDQHHRKDFQNLICAELFGKVIKLSAIEGEVVEPGQALLTLESMKTEIHVLSPVKGRIKKILVKEGNAVVEQQPLLELEAINGSHAQTRHINSKKNG